MLKRKLLYLSKASLNMVTVIKKGTPKDEIRKKIDAVVSQTPKKSIKEYAGVLKTAIDPLEYQKQIRDEWE